MGRDKALLRLTDGEALLEHALALAASVATEVKLIGPRARYASARWASQLVEDIYTECGPLGGIHAGLVASATEWNLVLAVDMPSVTRELLEFLLRVARGRQKLVTVAKVAGGWQPLCAVYKKAFSTLAEQALREGRCKVDQAFPADNTYIITEDELRQAGFSPDLFANCNTERDWQQFIARARRV